MALRDQLFDLSGKVALVTGAGSGLGRAFAHGLGAFGARVICADRNELWAQETVNLLAGAGAEAEPLGVDVTDPDSVAGMAAKLAASPGRVDILINNAGIATKPALVHEMPVEDWDRLMAVNLRGVFLCTRAILPIMLTRTRGSIINIASILGLVGFFQESPGAGANYAASKAGVIGFTRQVAVEYAGRGFAQTPSLLDGTGGRAWVMSAGPQRRPRLSGSSRRPSSAARPSGAGGNQRSCRGWWSIWRATPRATSRARCSCTTADGWHGDRWTSHGG